MRRMQLKTVAAAQNVVTQQARGTGFFERFFKALVGSKNLAVDVVITNGDAHGIGRNCHAFNHHVRVVMQDVAVFSSARFAFVRVAHQVFLTGELTRHEAPLQARWKARTATAPQTAGLHLGDDLIGRHALAAIGTQNFTQGLVAATRLIVFQAPVITVKTRQDLRVDVTAMERALHAGGSKLR